jgi:hypothetical protein
MNSTQLDAAFRKIGFGLNKRTTVDGTFWRVNTLHLNDEGWNCANLAEARSLLLALRERQVNGGAIIHDGHEWVCSQD